MAVRKPKKRKPSVAEKRGQATSKVVAEAWDAPTTARKVVKRQTEAKLQAKCIAWARDRGWWARKFSSPAQRSVPDYLLGKQCAEGRQLPLSVKLAVEFKKLGEISTQQQWDEQYLMWAAGWDVYECDNFEKFKRIILELEAVHTPAKEFEVSQDGEWLK